MGWYDSPELAAAGGGLGVTHPPGHPLWSALAALCSMLPLGALPLRIALGQALCLATTGLIAMHCAHALYLRCAGPHGARLAPFAAVAASLIGTLGTGAFRQATRVEVYALAGLVAVLLLALALDVDRSSRVRLREAGLVLGVGLANHHFIAITAAPLVGWIAWETWRESGATRRGRALLTAVAFVCIGLTVYVLLPLRADAPASIARVRSLGDWIDVASARVFAKNTGAGVPGTAGVRALDVLDWLGGSLTPLGLLFAAGGFYVALRDRSARGSALRLLTLIAVVAAARGWLGFVRDNPDAAGYLLPALVALGISSAAFVAGSIRALAEAPPPPKGPTRPARAVLTALLVGGPLLLPLVLAPRSVSASRIDRSAAPATLTA